MKNVTGRSIHIGGAIGVGVLTLMAWVAVKPAVNSRGSYRQLVNEFQRSREALAAAQDQEQATTRHLTDLRRSLAERPLVLRSQEDLSKRLQELTDLTSKVGLQLSSIEAGKAFAYDRYGAVAIQLNAHASFPALCNFLKDLRATMPDISVRSIDLVGRYTDKSSTPSLTMELCWHTAPAHEVASR